jgi:hypothetical protein
MSSEVARQRRLSAGLLLFSLACVAYATGLFDAGRAIEALPPLCLFHRLTGLDCPGCGMTRAFVCLLRGDLHGAWQMHPFSIPLLLISIAAVSLPAPLRSRLVRSQLGVSLQFGALAALLIWWLQAKVLPLGYSSGIVPR